MIKTVEINPVTMVFLENTVEVKAYNLLRRDQNNKHICNGEIIKMINPEFEYETWSDYLVYD